MRFKKKPVEIDAVKGNGRNFNEVEELGIECQKHLQRYGNEILIYTLEGTMKASLGDYIIKGLSGELYPCKPDIFELTYEPVK